MNPHLFVYRLIDLAVVNDEEHFRFARKQSAHLITVCSHLPRSQRALSRAALKCERG
jgi:hypothetical protein